MLWSDQGRLSVNLFVHPLSHGQITDATGVPRKTVDDWLGEKSQLTIFAHPPGRTDAQPWGNVQHFDVVDRWGEAGGKIGFLPLATFRKTL